MSIAFSKIFIYLQPACRMLGIGAVCDAALGAGAVSKCCKCVYAKKCKWKYRMLLCSQPYSGLITPNCERCV